MGFSKAFVRAGVLALSIGLTTSCGGGGDGEADPPLVPPLSEQSGAPASPSPVPQSFDQLPGPALVYAPWTKGGRKLTLEIKALKTEWVAQFGTTPAPAGEHFLVVHMAATPTAPDRGFENMDLSEINVRYAQPGLDSEACPFDIGKSPGRVADHCYKSNIAPKAVLVGLTDDWKTKDYWPENPLGHDLAPGEVVVGVGVYPIRDDAKPTRGFDLCGTGVYGAGNDGRPPGPCVPLETPDRP